MEPKIIEFKDVKKGQFFKLYNCKSNEINNNLILIRIAKRTDTPTLPDAYIVRSFLEHDLFQPGYPFYLKDFDKVAIVDL